MKNTKKGMKENILSILSTIRAEAGEPKIGTREVELVPDGQPQQDIYWKALKELRKEGKIVRRNGWMWITGSEHRKRLGIE